MQVMVIDYGSGNLQSVCQALLAASNNAEINADIALTTAPEEVANADAIVLPGVGVFADCASALRAQDGMEEALNEAVLKNGRPFLGICVGMQLMANLGFEGGTTQGLGWIEGEVKTLEADSKNLKIPHIGWNSLTLKNSHSVFEGIENGDAVYFLHSYAYSASDYVLAETSYGSSVTAAIGKDTMVGVQFHPEKSQNIGQQILTNWLNWKP